VSEEQKIEVILKLAVETSAGVSFFFFDKKAGQQDYVPQ